MITEQDVDGFSLLKRRRVGPAKGCSTQHHVPYKCLDPRFTNEPYKEQLFDDLCRDGPEWWQPKKQLAEACRLAGILSPHVVLQSALRSFLNGLDVCHVRQAACVYRKQTLIHVKCRHRSQRTTGMDWSYWVRIFTVITGPPNGPVLFWEMWADSTPTRGEVMTNLAYHLLK